LGDGHSAPGGVSESGLGTVDGSVANADTDRRNETADASIAVPNKLGIVSTDVQLLVVPVAARRVTDAKKMVLNELLAFVNCYRHNSTDDAVRQVVITHFSQDDIDAAKRLLVQEFQWLNGMAQFTTERRNSSARPAHEAEIDDIIGIIDVVNTRNALAGYMFVASNLQAMPKYGPEGPSSSTDRCRWKLRLPTCQLPFRSCRRIHHLPIPLPSSSSHCSPLRSTCSGNLALVMMQLVHHWTT
jgi:hypothetical protein